MIKIIVNCSSNLMRLCSFTLMQIVYVGYMQMRINAPQKETTH